MTASASSVLAVIPARGGSKGIPGKNRKPFLGKPLIEWSIRAAVLSAACNRVVVSTDDADIAEVSRRAGADVPFIRPAELALDTTPTAPVVRHVLSWLTDAGLELPSHVVILEPTSPGRQPFHIQEAMQRLITSGADSLASVSPIPHHYVPPKALDLRADGTIVGASGVAVADMIHRRQDLPDYYAFDGLIFACRTGLLLQDPPTIWGPRVLGYPVEPLFGVDLDQPEDWEPAEARLKSILKDPQS